MVITLQLGTEDNLPINKGTGGSEGLKCDPLKRHRPGKFQGDGSQGTLTSPFFNITREEVSFLIGSGCDIHTVRAELVINNQVGMLLIKTLLMKNLS